MGRILGNGPGTPAPQASYEMNVVWTSEALEDLEAVRVFIAKNDPAAAKRMVRRIYRYAADVLPSHPEIGRAGRIVGTRELVVPKTAFVVPYRLQASAIYVLRVYHAARRWPEAL